MKKIKEFKDKLSLMKEEEKDLYFEQLVRKWILLSSAGVLTFFLLLLLYANLFYESEKALAKHEKVDTDFIEEYRKLRFSSDYESVKDLLLEKKNEDLAKDYVMGQDMVAVAMTIPEGEVHNGFVGWATAIQNAQSDFTYNKGSVVIQQMNKWHDTLKMETLYEELFTEMVSRSHLIIETMNDVMWDKTNETYYSSMLNSLLKYERSGDMRYLEDMERVLEKKKKTFDGYGIENEWNAKIHDLKENVQFYKVEYENQASPK